MATIDFAWAQIGGPGSPPGVTVDFAWAQLQDTPVVATPPGPVTVTGSATGATTANITITDGSGGTAAHRVQVRPVGGAWADAVGATNPMPAGTLVFPATGLAGGLEHETQVRAERTGLNSTYVAGTATWWQDLPVGGGGELPTDTTAPTLTGTIAITALTSTSYTATCPAGSDAVGVASYQWRLGGSGAWTTIASGGRAVSFTGRTPATTDALEMRCLDAAGNISPVLSIGVNLLGIAPQVTTQPSAQSVVEGASFTFTAAFSGTPTPTRQWFRNGAPISGATGLSYSATATLADTGAVYTCVATNSAGSVTTNAATLTVTAGSVAPSIVTQPASQTVIAGQPVTFSVVVSGTTPISLQWRRNGVAISGATSTSYTFVVQAGDNGAAFDVVATNAVDTITSAAAALAVGVLAQTVALETALDRILPYANGCPDVTAVFHLRQAAIEFFQRTLAWQQWLPDITTVIGDDAYSMPLPLESAVVKLLKYRFDGSEEDLTNAATGEALAINTSSLDAGWTDDRVIFSVTPTPAEGGKVIRLRAALKPSQAANNIPAAQWEQYIHYIAYGALAGVLDIPSQTFTNTQQAAVWRGKFEEAIARVGAATARGFARTKQRVRAHYF